MAMLTQKKIDATKPSEKPLKLVDSGGLFLLIKPSGSRGWRYRYRYNGRESTISLGPYPTVSLKDARKLRDEARRALVVAGKNPADVRREERAARADTFMAVAQEWFEEQPLADSTRERNGRILDTSTS